MSVSYEHLNQAIEEQRGLNIEMGRVVAHVAQAAAAADLVGLLYVDGRQATYDAGGIFRRVSWVPSATVTGVATNNFTLTVNRYNAGALVAAVQTVSFAAGTNATAHVLYDLTSFANFAYNAGDVFEFVFHQVGTGLAVPAGGFAIETMRETQV